MNRENDELYQKAIQWYLSQYGENLEDAGFQHSAVWDKPCLSPNLKFFKVREIVFGKTEKGVRFFIKIQKTLRWQGIVSLAGVLPFMIFVLVTVGLIATDYFWYLLGIMGVVFFAFCLVTVCVGVWNHKIKGEDIVVFTDA